MFLSPAMESSNLPHRTKSRQDPKKAQAQGQLLGAQQSNSREKQSFYLVICGATDHTQGFIFSDFMGFCLALKENGVGGDFYSCFPLERHFAWLRNENNPPIDVIKFGKLGLDRSLYTYSRQAFLNHEYWWTQIGAHELWEKVQTWISEKKQQAEDGDVVNIIFEGRKNPRGEYCIGDNYVHPFVFRDLLAGFKKGVQVNAITGACYSGKFSDAIKSSNPRDRYAALGTTRSDSNRVRNSGFSQPFVQSLAKIKLPGVPRKQVTWRLKDHEAFMKKQLIQNLTPAAHVEEPHFYASEPLNGMTVVEDMVFRDKVDVVYDPRVSSRRRRIEWPTMDPNVRDLLVQGDSPQPSDVSPAAKAVIAEEISKCDTWRGLIVDLGIYDELYLRAPNWRQILRALYWRARRRRRLGMFLSYFGAEAFSIHSASPFQWIYWQERQIPMSLQDC